MSFAFVIVSLWIATMAVAAMALRNMIHCALCLVGALVGLAVVYLQLGAHFLGFAQMLVYVGAISVLIVFAMLLTRNDGSVSEPRATKSWAWGLGIAAAVFLSLSAVILSSAAGRKALPPAKELPVAAIGESLMTDHVLPLEIIALLLTAAKIGAAVLALHEPRKPGASPERPS